VCCRARAYPIYSADSTFAFLCYQADFLSFAVIIPLCRRRSRMGLSRLNRRGGKRPLKSPRMRNLSNVTRRRNDSLMENEESHFGAIPNAIQKPQIVGSIYPHVVSWAQHNGDFQNVLNLLSYSFAPDLRPSHQKVPLSSWKLRIENLLCDDEPETTHGNASSTAAVS